LVQLPDELAAQLDGLAAVLDRPREWLIEQALDRYIEQESEAIDAIATALAEYRAGNAAVLPHAVVMDRIAARVLQA